MHFFILCYAILTQVVMSLLYCFIPLALLLPSGDQYCRDWRLDRSHTLDRSWKPPPANGTMSGLGQSHDFRLQTSDHGRRTYDLGQASSVSSSGESLSRYRPATWLTELEARRTGRWVSWMEENQRPCFTVLDFYMLIWITLIICLF